MDVSGRVSVECPPSPFELATDHAMVAYSYRECVIFNVSNRGGRVVTSIRMNTRNQGNYCNFGQTFDNYFILTCKFCQLRMSINNCESEL